MVSSSKLSIPSDLSMIDYYVNESMGSYFWHREDMKGGGLHFVS